MTKPQGPHPGGEKKTPYAPIGAVDVHEISRSTSSSAAPWQLILGTIGAAVAGAAGTAAAGGEWWQSLLGGIGAGLGVVGAANGLKRRRRRK